MLCFNFREYQLTKRLFSTITDSDLDNMVKKVMGGNQKIGPNSIQARLLSMGFKVQRHRVRDSVVRVDPGGSAARTSVAIKRRCYRVAGPNSVWHIDGNHKLIRYM